MRDSTQFERRMVRLVVAGSISLVLVGCGSFGTVADLRQPSPVPTLSRLATTTPVTPSPTPLPTRPPKTPTTVPTPTPPVGVVTVAANIRSGPGTEYDIIETIQQGSKVGLLVALEGWYVVSLPDGALGWISDQVLLVDEKAAQAVPTATPEP